MISQDKNYVSLLRAGDDRLGVSVLSSKFSALPLRMPDGGWGGFPVNKYMYPLLLDPGFFLWI